MNRKFQNLQVKSIFEKYPIITRKKLLTVRELIFKIAAQADEIGDIEETLKWQEPSYLTHTPKSGTTIRLNDCASQHDKYVISVHCQTSLVSDFKEIYPQLDYDGNRSIILDVHRELPTTAVEHFIYSALTYHYRKKMGIGI